jgi:hypothetical protein
MNRQAGLMAIMLMPLSLNAEDANLNFQVNDYTDGGQFQSDAVMHDNGSSIVIWDSGCADWTCDPGDAAQDGNGYGVFAKRFDALGNELPAPADQGAGIGNEFQINTYTAGDQATSTIAIHPLGGYLAAWYSGNGQDGDDWGIFAQRLDAGGNKVCKDGRPLPGCPDDGDDTNGREPEFRINEFTPGRQRNPELAIAPNGDFVVIWEDVFGRDGDSIGIFGRMFNADGSPKGPDFQVNDHTAFHQAYFDSSRSLAMNRFGEFIVMWTDYSGQDSGGAYFVDGGVFAKRYDANGVPQLPPAAEQGNGDGFEFHVNRYRDLDIQSGSDIIAAPNGDFIISFSSNQGSGDSTAYAVRYDRAGNKVCPDGLPVSSGTCNDDGDDRNGIEPEFRITTFDTFGFLASLAMNDSGEMLAVWGTNGQSPSGFNDIYMQRFDPMMNRLCPDGQALATCPDDGDDSNGAGSELLVSRSHMRAQWYYSVALVDDHSLIVWNTYSAADGEFSGIYAQRTPTRGGDVFWDHLDVCPGVSDPGQEDTNGDGVGDACNDHLDPDGDEYESGARDICHGSSAGFCTDDFCGARGATHFCMDNCGGTANAGQEDFDQDGYGDACQPTLDLVRILEDGGVKLEVDVRPEDPNGDALSGSVSIRDLEIVILPISPFGTCEADDLWNPDGDPGEGISFSSIFGLRLLDADWFAPFPGCSDWWFDYLLAYGRCSDTLFFGPQIRIDNMPLPLDACVQSYDSGLLRDITVLSADNLEIVFRVVGDLLLEAGYEGDLPNSLSVRTLGLTAGQTYLLTITTTDGHSPERTVSGTFLYQGENDLQFNKVSICHDPGGNPHTLLVSGDTLATHLGHGDLDEPCEGLPPPPQPRPVDDVVICHGYGSGHSATLAVSGDSLLAHLAHDDQEGPCR